MFIKFIQYINIKYVNIDLDALAKRLRKKLRRITFLFILNNFTAIKSLSLFRDSEGYLKFNLTLKHTYKKDNLSVNSESFYSEVTYFYCVLLFFICEFRYFWKYLHRKYRYSRLLWGVYYRLIYFNSFLPLLDIFFRYFIRYRNFTHNLIRYIFWFQIALIEILPRMCCFFVDEFSALSVAYLYIYSTGKYLFFGTDFVILSSLIGVLLMTVVYFFKIFIFTFIFNALYLLILSLHFIPKLIFVSSILILLLIIFIFMFCIYLILVFIDPKLSKLRLKNPIIFKYWLSKYNVFLKKNS